MHKGYKHDRPTTDLVHLAICAEEMFRTRMRQCEESSRDMSHTQHRNKFLRGKDKKKKK